MNPIDDREARDLLGPLAGEPQGAQRLDLDEIIRGGNRRRRTRHLMTGVLSAAAVVVLAGGAAAVAGGSTGPTGGVEAADTPSPYETDGLPSPPASQPPPPLPSAAAGAPCTLAPLAGAQGFVTAVDHTGHYTVEERGNTDLGAVAVRTAVVRKDGREVAAVTLPASARTEYAVNASGEFAVTIADSQKNGVPYAYVDGKLVKLKGGAGAVRAITDSGRIGGTLAKDDQPVVWKTATGEPTLLPLPEGAVRGGVTGIDEDGTVAGHVFTADNNSTAVLWMPDGKTRTIPVPAEQNPSYLVGIRDGWVAGGTSLNGFRYNIKDDEYEVLRAQGSNPQAMSGNGSVVAAPQTNTMYVLAGATAHKLATEPDPEVISYNITGVSDDGRTVTGNSFTKVAGSEQSEIQAVTWTCG